MSRTPGRALAIAASGTLLALVAFTLPLATLNATAADLGAGVAGRTWILSSMSIGLAAALMSSGTIADDYGRRRTFCSGMILLVVGSIVCATVPEVAFFVLGRLVQGVGGAAVIASSLGIIAHAFPPGPARAHASGIWGASVGAGIAIGPLASAGLDKAASWTYAYWLLALTGVLLAVAAYTQVNESKSDATRGLDLPGALTLAGGTSALLAALVEGRQGWSQPSVIVLGVLAIVLLLLFIVTEARSTSPMLDLALFRHPPFLAATTAAFATGMGVIALLSFLPAFLGLALGVSALQAAALLFVWSGTSVVTALLARHLPASVSGRIQLGVGLIAIAIGQAAMLGVTASSTAVRFVPGLFIAGMATGVVNAALGREAVASVPAGRGGMGSGANNTARYVGSAIGVTIVAVIATHPAAGTPQAALSHGWNTAVSVTAALSAIGGLVVLICKTRTKNALAASLDLKPGPAPVGDLHPAPSLSRAEVARD